ncbi:hypothetical protein JGC47_16985 [Erwinia amylovora]|uniref:Uncharacterized protein n=1 Tax=Erwinia amylovora TaxID=552 RepID=A0ABX7MIM7_ERWAM|nr:hypothetical protein [Erwinia amylovora]QSI91707.1 hypothetical protein JGC47_16985 [Erwinia amylovora]
MLVAKMDAENVSPSAEGAKKGDRMTCRLFLALLSARFRRNSILNIKV